MQLSKLNIPGFSKIPAFLFAALLLNLAIFMLIQQLVNKELGVDVKRAHFRPVEFVRIKQQEPPKPEEEIEDIEPTPSITDQEPPPPEMLEPKIQGVRSRGINQALSKIYVPLSRSGISQLGDPMKSTKNNRFGIPMIDINVVPTLRISPIYPINALRSGIGGLVTVEFTITTNGSVKDLIVVNANPEKIFDRAVLRALSKWKFNPDVMDGKVVEKRARQDVKFIFQGR